MRKRSFIIILVTLAAVASALFVSDTLMAPESPAYKDGEEIRLRGSLTCLQHKDQSGPVTAECALGFIDTDGHYYALRDETPMQSFITGVPQGKDVEISGVYRTGISDKYVQEGTIEIKGIID